jgi:LuxR family maltose regulon positive regulatory protein
MPRLLADFPQALHLVEHIEATSGDASDRFDLSRQELRILQILANEASNKEIAAAFSVSLPTVKTHLRHIYRKLGVHSRAEAVRVARAMGIGDPKIKSSRVRCQ